MCTNSATYRESKTLMVSDEEEDESDESSSIYLFISNIYFLLLKFISNYSKNIITIKLNVSKYTLF